MNKMAQDAGADLLGNILAGCLIKAACFMEGNDAARVSRKRALGCDGVNVPVRVDRRTKSLKKGHGPDSGAWWGRGGCAFDFSFHGSEKNADDGAGMFPIVQREKADSLGKGDHPLPVWDAGKHAIEDQYRLQVFIQTRDGEVPM